MLKPQVNNWQGKQQKESTHIYVEKPLQKISGGREKIHYIEKGV